MKSSGLLCISILLIFAFPSLSIDDIEELDDDPVIDDLDDYSTSDFQPMQSASFAKRQVQTPLFPIDSGLRPTTFTPHRLVKVFGRFQNLRPNKPIGSFAGWLNAGACMSTDPLLCMAHNATHLCYAWSEPGSYLLLGNRSDLIHGHSGQWSNRLTFTSVPFSTIVNPNLDSYQYDNKTKTWNKTKLTHRASGLFAGVQAYEACSLRGNLTDISVQQVDSRGYLQFPMKPFYYHYKFAAGRAYMSDYKPRQAITRWNPSLDGITLDGLTYDWNTTVGTFMAEPFFSIGHNSTTVCFAYRSPIFQIFFLTKNVKSGYLGLTNARKSQYFTVSVNKLLEVDYETGLHRLRNYIGTGLNYKWSNGTKASFSGGRYDAQLVYHHEVCFPIAALKDNWEPLKIMAGYRNGDHWNHFPPRPYFLRYGKPPVSTVNSTQMTTPPKSYPTIAPTPFKNSTVELGAKPYPPECKFWNATLFNIHVSEPTKWLCARMMFLTLVKFAIFPSERFNFKKEEALLFKNDSLVFPYAQSLFLNRPLDCLIKPGSNNMNDYCDIISDWRPYDGKSDIPYCKATYCWFNPGSECLARVWKFRYLPLPQKELVIKVPSLHALLTSFHGIIGEVVTRCFPPEKLVGKQCPINHCFTVNSSRSKRLVKLLDRIKRSETCPNFACGSCSSSDSNSDRSCVGVHPIDNSPQCCTCTLDFDAFSFDFNLE